MRQDIPLISAMRSVVFGFTVNELVEIRIPCRKGSFFSAVMNYAEQGSREELRNKIKSMNKTVSLWKEISRTVPLEELMKVILYDTGYYEYCSGLPVGVQRISISVLLPRRLPVMSGSDMVDCMVFSDT